jgi:hypothetical protein
MVSGSVLSTLSDEPVLPVGTVSDQKTQFGKNFEGFAMEEASIFSGHLV